MQNEFLPLFYTFHFYLFGLIALASALAFVTRKSPVAAALWLVMTMFALAALYVMLDAQFIGMMQVLVYAGAIAVLMLFAIFLTRNAMTQGNLSGKFQLPALALAVLVFVSFAYTFLMARWAPSSGQVYTAPDEVADALFGPFVFPFELASVLLLVAMIGAIVVARAPSDDEAEDA